MINPMDVVHTLIDKIIKKKQQCVDCDRFFRPKHKHCDYCPECEARVKYYACLNIMCDEIEKRIRKDNK